MAVVVIVKHIKGADRLAEKQTSARSDVKISENTQKFRRIITGHDAKGEAIFIDDAICPNRFACGGLPNFVTNEMWIINEIPDNNEGDGSDTATAFSLNPPKGGNVFRILELPPDSDLGKQQDGTPVTPTMHRTPSTDYAYVIEGEVYAVLDKQEKLMRKGDVLIQRGTNHAWSNRSDKPCIILFVLNGGHELPGLPPQ